MYTSRLKILFALVKQETVFSLLIELFYFFSEILFYFANKKWLFLWNNYIQLNNKLCTFEINKVFEKIDRKLVYIYILIIIMTPRVYFIF